jgi:hypothetical protein
MLKKHVNADKYPMMFLDNGEEKLKRKTSSYNQCLQKNKNEEKGDLDLQHSTTSILAKSHVLCSMVSILLQLSSMNLSGLMISLSLI